MSASAGSVIGVSVYSWSTFHSVLMGGMIVTSAWLNMVQSSVAAVLYWCVARTTICPVPVTSTLHTEPVSVTVDSIIFPGPLMTSHSMPLFWTSWGETVAIIVTVSVSSPLYVMCFSVSSKVMDSTPLMVM